MCKEYINYLKMNLPKPSALTRQVSVPAEVYMRINDIEQYIEALQLTDEKQEEMINTLRQNTNADIQAAFIIYDKKRKFDEI